MRVDDSGFRALTVQGLGSGLGVCDSVLTVVGSGLRIRSGCCAENVMIQGSGLRLLV